MFGINAELLIDHAWGWEPCRMEDIKAYRPETNSICSGQVLQCPYSFEKARLVVREMAEAVALDLLEKKLVTDQLTLTVGYDIENTAGGSYHGETVTDRYGRKIPKHTHGTANLPRKTSSARSITDAVLGVYDAKVNSKLSIRRLTILKNERYAGNALLQKRYTTDAIPFKSKRNHGEKKQYFVEAINDAIISQETFDQAQKLRRERKAEQGSQHNEISRQMRCACGSRVRAKQVNHKWYWVCCKHDEGNDCPLKPVPEEQVSQAFLRVYYKLKHYGIEVLTQLISDLYAVRTGSLLWSENIVEINKQISDIASQERLLTQLKQQGSVDPDIFISRGNLLAERRRELKLQKERILRSEEDHTIQQTQDLLDVLESGPDWLDDFDEQLFSDMVEKIVVVDNETLRFRLLNGLEVTEKIERTQR